MKRRYLSRAIARSVVALTGAGGILFAINPAQADDIGPVRPELLVLLDASGSMDEAEPTGSTRMEIAQEAVTGVAEELPRSANMGLRAFGPSETGDDCDASELLVPIGEGRDGIVDTVNDLEPAGSTPLAYSLEQAADDFFDSVTPKTIVLISDGEDTCDGDPVDVAENITDQGLDLRIHVIGYDVDNDTRDQLIRVAQAGNGSYYDAQDGAALVSRLSRASEFAIDPYEPIATPIEGSDDGLDVPLLSPGHYVDTKYPNTDSDQPVKYYAFDLEEETTVHFGANIPWASPPGVEWSSNHDITILTDSDRVRCDSSSKIREQYNDGGIANVTRSLAFAWDEDAAANECGAAGRYIVEVSNSSSNITRNGPAPLEFLFGVEPNVDASELPEPFSQEGDLPRADSTGDIQEVVGANGFSDAPIIEDGRWEDTIRPGEEVIYRIPVDWGERVATRLDLPDLDSELSDYIGGVLEVDKTLMSPTWNDVSLDGGTYQARHYSGDPLTLEGATAEVRYRNRFAEDAPDEVRAASYPGHYYLKVRMNGNADNPYFELPINIAVETIGDANDGPDYSDATFDSQPGEQLSVELLGDADASKNESGTPFLTIPVIAGAAAVLLASGGAVAWVLSKRKRSEEL